MERDALRLECLKLAVGKTSDHFEAMMRAEDFFTFVTKNDDNVRPAHAAVTVGKDDSLPGQSGMKSAPR